MSFNASNIKIEAAYIDFIEETVNAKLSNHLNVSELYKSIRLTKFIITL